MSLVFPSVIFVAANSSSSNGRTEIKICKRIEMADCYLGLIPNTIIFKSKVFYVSLQILMLPLRKRVGSR